MPKGGLKAAPKGAARQLQEALGVTACSVEPAQSWGAGSAAPTLVNTNGLPLHSGGRNMTAPRCCNRPS